MLLVCSGKNNFGRRFRGVKRNNGIRITEFFAVE